MPRHLTVLCCLLLALGCAAHADRSTRLASDVAALRPGVESFLPPRANKSMPLAAGQWVEQHVVDQNGKHAFVTNRVLALHGRQVWLETTTVSESGTRSLKLRVSLGARRDPRSIEVYEYWQMDETGRVEQLPPFLLGSVKPALQSALASVLTTRAPELQEDIVVPAGRFAGAYKARVSIDVLGGHKRSELWWHPAVPLNGGVASVGIGSPERSELVRFGLSGARSVFP